MNDWFAHKIIGLPELDASTGQAVDNLIVYIHYLVFVLLVGWTAYFFYVLWRFGAKRNPKADYDGSKSLLPKYSEIGVVVVEMFLLFILAVPLWGKKWEAFPIPTSPPSFRSWRAAVRLERPLSWAGREVWQPGHETHQ